MNASHDPVLARRAAIARRVRWASRAGYGALGVSMIAFAAAVATGFPSALVNVTIAGLVATCLILPVTIIVGYGIRAAEREERSGGVLGRAGRRSGATRQDGREQRYG